MKIQSSGIELNQIWDSRTNTIFLHKHHIFYFFENMLTMTKKKKYFHDDEMVSLEEALELSVDILAPEGETYTIIGSKQSCFVSFYTFIELSSSFIRQSTTQRKVH